MPFKGNISRSRGAERPGRITKLPPSKPHQCSFTQQAQVILSYQQPPWEKSVVHPSRALSPVSGYPRLSVIARGPVSAPGGESAQLGRKPCLAPEGDMLQAGTALLLLLLSRFSRVRLCATL